MSLRVRHGVASLQGKRRRNEDAAGVVVAGPTVVLAVADGLGGHANGDVASKAAIEALPEALRAGGVTREPRLGRALAAADPAAEAAFAELNRAVWEAGGSTTLSLVGIVPEHAAFALMWCGDSPALHLRRPGRGRALAVVAEATPHGYANWVSRCLGGGPNTPHTPDVLRGTVEPGDVFLVASDGLDVLLDDEAARLRTLRRLSASLARGDQLGPLAERMAQAAIDAGSTDNVTVAIAVVEAA